ncbi:MAG: hypothetical protein EBR82_65735 [Caulobacteraceae bacterium]|nr:hypothetical protein [Caulobacteraceae bacterium]
MTLEELQHLLNLMDADNKKIRDAYRLGIDLIEFTESAQEVVNTLLKHVFDEHQYETLSWWMYEKDFGRREDLQMWDADGNEVCRTVEELHQFLFA